MTSPEAGPGRSTSPRERMVRSAAQLIRRKGVSGTGLREIVAEADAPRGSLQHYFPAGKEELVGEALLWMGDVAARRVRRHMDRDGCVAPSDLLGAIIGDWQADLAQEQYAAGCPLLAAAADVAATSEQMRQVLRTAFDNWQEPLAEALVEFGVVPKRARALASVVISGLEGAIILSRIRHDLTPLDALVNELGPLLDAAAGRIATRRKN